MARLHRDDVRARIRAAIGEPDPAPRGLDLGEIRTGRRRRTAAGPGDLPVPLRVPALAVLLVAIAGAVTAGAVLGLRQRSPTAPAPASRRSGSLQGPTVAAFVPADVTAISTDEWWVAGRETSHCSGTGCSRILWTVNAGASFTAIPAPPIALSHLRFANAHDGWAYDGVSAAIWATHDGGGRWSMSTLPGPVTGLETSGGYVYAIVCPRAASACLLERSADAGDAWTPLPLPAGSGRLSDVNVHGSDLWVLADRGRSTATLVLRSTDDGSAFASAPVCGAPGAGAASLDAVDPAIVWAICSSPAGARAWLSLAGGSSFKPVDAQGSVPGLSIAATSAMRAVVAGSSLEMTTDGGVSFRSVLDTGARWTLIGFTTATAGFALADVGRGDASLWRTDDGGAVWRQVNLSS